MSNKSKLVLVALVIASQVGFVAVRLPHWKREITTHNKELPPGYTLLRSGNRFSFKDGDGMSFFANHDGYDTERAAISAAWEEHEFFLNRKEYNWTNANTSPKAKPGRKY